MKRIVCALILVFTFVSVALAQKSSADEEKVWAREQAYWKYVQAADLEGYRSLWHQKFLGWPFFSPEPVGKNHITDWITDYTGKGQRLKSYDLERRELQVIDNLVTVTYRVRATWANKDNVATTQSTRIIHTWIRNPDGTWQIISGMSAPTDAEGH